MTRLLALLGMLAAAALLVTTPASAQDLHQVHTALERGDYATAVPALQSLAGQGHADAQYELGRLYEQGRGVPQDYAAAARWYRQAAEQGLADAQHDLGTLYGHGSGVPQDFERAVYWCRKAGLQGHALAQAKVAARAEMGMGVSQDAAEAARWYRMAADQGAAVAQLNLGLLYAHGRGVDVDAVEARMILLAIRNEAGSTRTRARRELMGLDARLRPEQIAKAEERAAAWRPRSQR